MITGAIAPPTIVMMSREEANLVFVPASLNASEEIVGNIMFSPRYRAKNAMRDKVPEEEFVLGIVGFHHIYFNDFGNSSPNSFNTSMNLSFISFSLKYSSETKFRRAIGCFELLNTSMTA